MTIKTKERRFMAADRALLRAAGEGEAQADIGGYAATFNSPTMIGDWFREQVAPGAFADAIKRCDVRALFNHDANFVLGRNVAKTLTLAEDDKGLIWRATPPATQWARDLAVSIERGDISGCSFCFYPIVEEWDYQGDTPLRTLVEVEIDDVSVVTFPAYADTTAALRTLTEARARDGQAAPPTAAGVSAATLSRIAAKRGLLDRLTRA